MIATKPTNFLKAAALAVCTVAFCISTTSVANADSKINASTKASTIRKRHPSEVKRTLLEVIERKAKTNPKLAKAIAASCGCCLATEELGLSGFGSCFKNCLTGNGVNPMTAAACAGGCFSNPVGCVFCVGIAEWIVLGCAQYCVWYKVFDSASLRPPRIDGLRPAKLLRKPAIVSS